jgi:cytochrome P450
VSRIDLNSFNFFDPELQAYPHAMYAQAIDESPVLLLPGTDIYLITSHALVAQACARTDDFSNDITVLLSGTRAEVPEIKTILDKGWPQQNVLLMSDPPAHSRYRKLVNLAFSLKRVDAIEGQIRAIINRLIEDMAVRNRCDFVTEFATPLPVAVIAGQLGLPPEDIARVKKWTTAFTDRIGGMISIEREIECAHDVVEFQQAMKVQIDARHAAHHDDLLGDLVAARIDGEAPLSIKELMSILQQILVAGNETTTNTLSEGLLILIQQPAAMAKLRADPSLIPNAVEEILRLASPVQGNWRIVIRDCELGGVAIPAGSKLMIRLAAANRDPARYEQPDILVPERTNARGHLAFGRGIHQCIGNLLARRELSVAFEVLLARFDEIALDCDPATLVYPPNVMLRGMRSLPIRLGSSPIFNGYGP